MFCMFRLYKKGSKKVSHESSLSKNLIHKPVYA